MIERREVMSICDSCRYKITDRVWCLHFNNAGLFAPHARDVLSYGQCAYHLPIISIEERQERESLQAHMKQNPESALTLKLSKIVHDSCENVPHDIGFNLVRYLESKYTLTPKHEEGGRL